MLGKEQPPEIRENDDINRIFSKAMKSFCEKQAFFEKGCFLPQDMVDDFIAVSKNGNTQIKVIALKLLASYTFRNQIPSLEPHHGIDFLKEGAELRDIDCINYLKNINDDLIEVSEYKLHK